MVFVVLILIVIGVLLSMLASSLVVAVGSAMFLDLPWKDSFDKVWDQPGYLLLFSFIILPFILSIRND